MRRLTRGTAFGGQRVRDRLAVPDRLHACLRTGREPHCAGPVTWARFTAAGRRDRSPAQRTFVPQRFGYLFGLGKRGPWGGVVFGPDRSNGEDQRDRHCDHTPPCATLQHASMFPRPDREQAATQRDADAYGGVRLSPPAHGTTAGVVGPPLSWRTTDERPLASPFFLPARVSFSPGPT